VIGTQTHDCETAQGLPLVHTNNVKREHHTEKVRRALRSITSAGNNHTGSTSYSFLAWRYIQNW